MGTDSCRIAILGSPFTPIHELGDRIAVHHNLDFITIEGGEIEDIGYFADKIDAKYLDAGDFSIGSASQHGGRDVSAWEKMRELSEVGLIPPGKLNEMEKRGLGGEDFAVVSSEIPDEYFVGWSDALILLVANEDTAISWLDKRRKCGCCGAVYHLDESPPLRRGYCDRCGSHIFQQECDLPKNVRAQYREWGRSLWGVEKKMKEKKGYIKVNVEKYDGFENMYMGIERALRKVLHKTHEMNWNYSIYA